MQTISQFLNDYFSDHKEQLQNNYPGLKLTRLEDEFLEYYQLRREEAYVGQGRDFLSQLNQAVPLEYIQKSAYFYRSSFYVDDRVLIPRSESEILVEDAVKYVKRNKHDKFKIAEIGVGSFALGLSLMADLDFGVEFWGGDISMDALAVAQINQFRMGPKLAIGSKIELCLSDRLKGTQDKFDLIISNPPYICEDKDRDGVHFQANVFEPHIALYLSDNNYDSWFSELFHQVASSLVPGGMFMMEGHEDNLLHLQEIALKYFNKVKIKEDYTHRPRFIHACKDD